MSSCPSHRKRGHLGTPELHHPTLIILRGVFNRGRGRIHGLAGQWGRCWCWCWSDPCGTDSESLTEKETQKWPRARMMMLRSRNMMMMMLMMLTKKLRSDTAGPETMGESEQPVRPWCSATFQISSDGKESQHAKVARRRNPPRVRSADARMDVERCRAEIRALRKIEREWQEENEQKSVPLLCGWVVVVTRYREGGATVSSLKRRHAQSNATLVELCAETFPAFTTTFRELGWKPALPQGMLSQTQRNACQAASRYYCSLFEVHLKFTLFEWENKQIKKVKRFIISLILYTFMENIWRKIAMYILMCYKYVYLCFSLTFFITNTINKSRL